MKEWLNVSPCTIKTNPRWNQITYFKLKGKSFEIPLPLGHHWCTRTGTGVFATILERHPVGTQSALGSSRSVVRSRAFAETLLPRRIRLPRNRQLPNKLPLIIIPDSAMTSAIGDTQYYCIVSSSRTKSSVTRTETPRVRRRNDFFRPLER